MVQKIKQAESIIGYEFEDKNWLWEALQVAGSKVKIEGRCLKKGNARLAIHGELKLKAIRSKLWAASEDESLADWNTTATRLIGTKILAKTCVMYGLTKVLNINPDNPLEVSDRLAATLVEAVIGAVSMDGGEAAVMKVLKELALLPLEMLETNLD